MKILHIDLETSPNTAHVWGLWKQNIGINQLLDSSETICFAAKWHGKRGIEFQSVHHNDYETMVNEAWRLLDEADAVVHFNGARFDIPTLNKEFLASKLGPPSPYHQVDLLKVSRQQFRFPSNKLDYIVQKLGLGKKTKHMGHELWLRCMNDDPAAWKKMRQYNIMDVKLLEKLYNKLLPWIKAHPNHALYSGSTRPTCPNCGGHKLQRRGTVKTKTQVYVRYSCQDCGTWTRDRKNSTPDKPVLVQA